MNQPASSTLSAKPTAKSGLETRIFPARLPQDTAAEAADVWGFKDTTFFFNAAGDVELSGSRYLLCGQGLPHLRPWVESVLGVRMAPEDERPRHRPTAVAPARAMPGFLKELKKSFRADQCSDEDKTRLRHGHGHSLAEMYAVKCGGLGRIPDLVVYPEEVGQVVHLVATAQAYKVCLIPFGGGTNVTWALRCPAEETRPIVSVDMRRMNRIVWIDRVNKTACIEAGAVGRHIVSALAAHGYTLGHEPDSIEFSTMGGWVATKASGMKKNKYGNMENLLLDVHAVTADGAMQRQGSAPPRESIGYDTSQLLLGSEGRLGIVTSAVVKLSDLPEKVAYGSVVLPNFERGLELMYELTHKGVMPASIRLVDNTQFQFSLALKGRARGLKALRAQAEKFFVTKVKGLCPNTMVACSLVFEGRKQDVAAQKRAVFELAKQLGGMSAGPDNGRRGYLLTYGIAYIRDFVMKYGILAESFETSVPWSRAAELCRRVKARVVHEHAERQLPGKVLVTCRVSQVYATGVCVYFYMGFPVRGVERPDHVFAQIEEAAREEILACDGSLSHHHGVGKLRKPFLPQVLSPVALKWRQGVKDGVDPDNVFGCAN